MSVQLKVLLIALLFSPALVMAASSDSERLLYGKLGYATLVDTNMASDRMLSRDLYDPHGLLIHSIYPEQQASMMDKINREIKTQPTAAGDMVHKNRDIFDANRMFIQGDW